MRVGFLGLGRMGRPMVGSLVAAGFAVTVWNRTAAVAHRLADELGVATRDTPGAVAAEVDVVASMLADDAAVEQVHLGPDGVLSAARPGLLVIDHSTVAPATAHRLAAALGERGTDFIDAPVSGSTEAAASRSLTLMVGGDPAHVAAGQPVLAAMGSRVYHVGQVGAGAALKLAVNTIVYGLTQAISEALVLAERAGIERHTAYEVFANSAIAAPLVHYRRPVFERPGADQVMFRLALAGKDLRLITALAEHIGAPMPQARCNLAALGEAEAAGYGDWDLAAVAAWLRHLPAT